MTKGKPWDINEERQLRVLFEDGKTIDEIAKIMVKTHDAVLSKVYGLGLKREEEDKPRGDRLSSSFMPPPELPTVEDALKKVAAAVRALEEPGLAKTEVFRLRSVISGVKDYKEIFADYINYCELEGRLVELEGKYKELVRRQKT